jgi:Coenzyme PQQ synthesis protein D (PqqD)
MRYHHAAEVTWELADERAVILDAAGRTLTTLNPVGTIIWQYLDEARDGTDIVGQLARRFPGVDRDQLHDDAEAFLAGLLDGGLLVSTADG